MNYLKMTINDIISKHFTSLQKYIQQNKDTVISNSKTEEDILQDVCVTAMNKYKNEDILEEDGLSYLKKTLYYEQRFQYNHKAKDKLVFMENIGSYDIPDDDLD